ncbi:class I SAM-dependent methyltransferase [Oscillatoria salina]|uniref:class I SAM-dependent methyltransferase n=1 Tax=Oscillatoria salina TaxID=331517 RepID=UPI0013BD0E83|nr:class I SAM-dependent methyltransferase [Oscillatoria salina]MBZ8180875.1 class I SAM-dependent methyltransferase [Oscillatoria salina IIICB1]NET86944.1 class I SAM-dependent methyltransferase [Kamptonema sp. SIO1D9]
MATILRNWSYRYQWLYDSISALAALSVGGEQRLRNLAWGGLTIHKDTQILDLCCGAGQVTRLLVKHSNNVTGLDASPFALQRASRNVPEAEYVEAFAEDMPFAESRFDLVHTSVALHEMSPAQLKQILQEVYRVLQPGGIFALIDLHKPTNPLFFPGLAVFMWLFETETAWQLLETDLVHELETVGFAVLKKDLHAGGSLQVIQAKK